MSWDPGLTPAEIERLDLLVEECSEVIKAAQKIKRFGYWSTHGGSHPPNVKEFVEECGDVLAILTLMRVAGDAEYEINMETLDEARRNKLERMVPYVRFQQETFVKLFKEENE
jgi:NTP pyrophosphatase (non-canonical NTP hydrolase)